VSIDPAAEGLIASMKRGRSRWSVKPTTIVPIDRAKPFDLEELFYSTTDRKGIIETGNDVFYRVSGYVESQIVGQPHNIVRHPDMPRAAFRVVWEHLLAKRTVAAYVKNLSTDGCYYWVLALIAPIEGGFISVRTKTSSPLFATVEGIYKAMKAKEEELLEKGEPPQAAITASLQVLNAQLNKLGFKDYDDFTTRALLPQELAARKTQLVEREARLIGGNDPVLEAVSKARADLQRTRMALKAATSRLGPVLERNARTSEFSKRLTNEAEGIGLTAMNVSLKAVQLGEVGLGTGVIAGFLGEGARLLRSRVEALSSRLEEVSARLSAVVVESNWGELEYEMVVRALDEVAATQAGGSADATLLRRRVLGLDRLRQGVMGTRHRMTAALAPFLQALQGIDQLSDAANEQAIALGAAHVGGRVESARLPSTHSMEGILHDLRGQLDAARSQLQEIKDSVAALSELRAVMASTEQVVLEGANALARNIASLEKALGDEGAAQKAA
jgi:aerotaxis receptor